MQNVKEILDLMKSLTPQDGAIIEKAYMVAEKAHDGQKRFTGDPYVKHSFETAKNLAVFGMDATRSSRDFSMTHWKTVISLRK